MKNNILGYISLAVAGGIWGGMYVVSKHSLGYIHPFTLIFLRYLVALIPIFIIYKFKFPVHKASFKSVRKNCISLLLIGGLGYFLSISFQFIGTFITDAHTGSLITASTPALMIIFSRTVLKEKLEINRMAAIILSTFGIIIIVGFIQIDSRYVFGGFILFLAALIWSYATIMVKKLSEEISILEITMYAMLIALIISVPFTVWEAFKYPAVQISWDFVISTLYIGLAATAGAFFLWNYGISKVNTGTGSLFYFLQPIVATVLGAIFLDEKITVNFFIGGLLILLSIILSIVRIKRKTNIVFEGKKI